MVKEVAAFDSNMEGIIVALSEQLHNVNMGIQDHLAWVKTNFQKISRLLGLYFVGFEDRVMNLMEEMESKNGRGGLGGTPGAKGKKKKRKVAAVGSLNDSNRQ